MGKNVLETREKKVHLFFLTGKKLEKLEGRAEMQLWSLSFKKMPVC